MKKLTILCLSFFLFSSAAEAQFFKKLKDKVEKKVEDAVIDNVSDKAAKEAEKSLENLWSMDNLPVPMGGERVDPAVIPESYDFNWEYNMSMETTEGNMKMTYLLKDGEPYFGLRVPNAEQMLMVMDNEKELMVMFMDSGENKMITATKYDPEISETTQEENPYMSSDFEEIGTKEILGYTCKGYKTETEDYSYTFYITDEAEIDFKDIYQANKKNMQDDFNPEWLKDGKGLMMEMEMVDKSDPSKNVNMTCTGIEEKDFTVNKEDYTGF